MSRFFPHTAYAEDQPLGHTILLTHVLTRGITSGTIVAATITGVRHVVPALRSTTAPPLPQRLLLSASKGTLIGVGLTAAATAARMYGREDIEWRDRSWRLLENQGQVEVDDWTYLGMGMGAAAVLANGRMRATTGWRGVVGAAGLGSVGGMIGYMGWRHGINGGKFPERKQL